MKIYITTKIFSILISPKSWNRNTWSNTGRVVENVKRCINNYNLKFINESRNFTLDFVGLFNRFQFLCVCRKSMHTLVYCKKWPNSWFERRTINKKNLEKCKFTILCWQSNLALEDFCIKLFLVVFFTVSLPT